SILEEANDRQESFKDRLIQYGTDVVVDLNPFTTHSDLREGYKEISQKDADYRLTAGDILNKLQNPVLFDIGVGNIQIYTAIRLLQDYKKQFATSDPLDVKKYDTDYTQLVEDLNTWANPATVKFAGLMVQEAGEWGQQNVANWSDLTPVEK